MDVLTFLTDDHDEARLVFKKLEEAHGSSAMQLWNQLEDMLTLHVELEEMFFYPQLRQDKDTEDLVLESYEEHHVMDVLIEEISQLEPSDETWHPKLKVLQETTEHHIDEEEGDLFPKVRKIWDTRKREEVGRQMQQRKNERDRQRSAA